MNRLAKHIDKWWQLYLIGLLWVFGIIALIYFN